MGYDLGSKGILPTMSNFPDALTLLLQVFSPGKTHEEQFALLEGLDESEWGGLVMEAQQQNVGALLYLQIIKQSKKLNIPDTLLEELHNTYISNAGRSTFRMHSVNLLLCSLKQAGIDVIGLKGIYLIENLYSDIGARSMSDIDILVRKQDLGRTAILLEGQGYEKSTYFDSSDSNLDIKHIPPMIKPGSPPVEVHWSLLEADEPVNVDIDSLWQRAKPAQIADVEVLALSLEDLIAHLCLHLTYQHFLKLGLRGLYDVALILYRFGNEIDWAKLVEIARSWGAEKVVALTLALASELLGVHAPSEVSQGLLDEEITPEVLAQAKSQLLGRGRNEAYLTPDLVTLAGERTLFGKIRLGLSRVFLPRLTLARLYGVAPNSPRILSCYLERLKYLVRQYGRTVLRIRSGDDSLAPALESGKVSEELHAWMTPRF